MAGAYAEFYDYNRKVLFLKINELILSLVKSFVKIVCYSTLLLLQVCFIVAPMDVEMTRPYSMIIFGCLPLLKKII